MTRRLVGSLVIATALATAPTAGAQSLSEQFGGLFRFGTCDQPLCLSVNEAVHGSHYLGAAVAANGQLLSFLTDAITVSLNRVPISATSGGSTFSFVGGAPVRTTVSAGPIFAERAQTLGRGRFLLGANTTGISFSEIRGVSLDELALNFSHVDVGAEGLGSPAFESDVIAVRAGLDVNLQVTSFFATYGLTDNVDVSVAVPLVRSSLDATSVGTITNADGGISGVHFFGTEANPLQTATGSVSGSHFGLGDIAARMKVNLRPGAQGLGVALLADARLPTGDEENFTGSGDLSARLLGILSNRYGNFSPHLNAGYALRTGDAQTDAVLATVGFDQLLAPWATLAADLISEWQVGDSRELPEDIVFLSGQQLPATNIPNQRDDVLSASLGARFTARGFSFVVNGLFPLRDAGLQSGFIWTLGAERSF